MEKAAAKNCSLVLHHKVGLVLSVLAFGACLSPAPKASPLVPDVDLLVMVAVVLIEHAPFQINPSYAFSPALDAALHLSLRYQRVFLFLGPLCVSCLFV